MNKVLTENKGWGLYKSRLYYLWGDSALPYLLRKGEEVISWEDWWESVGKECVEYEIEIYKMNIHRNGGGGYLITDRTASWRKISEKEFLEVIRKLNLNNGVIVVIIAEKRCILTVTQETWNKCMGGKGK